MLNEFLEKAEGELFANEIRHQECAAFGLVHAFHFAREDFLHFRFGERAGEFFPKRNVGRLGQLENFSRHHALRDERRFFAQREFRRILSLHEPRKHLSQQRRGRPKIFGETILNETGERVVKTVGKEQRRSALAVDGAIAGANLFEKIRGCRGGRRFGKSRSDKHSAVIVRAGSENFLPRLRMSRRKIMFVGQLIDFLRRQLAEDIARQLAQKRVTQTVQTLEMFEEKNESLEMRRFQFAIDAVKRVGNGVNNLLALQVTLQIENIVAQLRRFRCAALRKFPRPADLFCMGPEGNTS